MAALGGGALGCAPRSPGGRLVLAAAGEHFPRLQRIWADQGSTGELQRWAAERSGLTLEVVYPPTRQLKRYAPELLEEDGLAGGFHVLPKRWMVEITQAQNP